MASFDLEEPLARFLEKVAAKEPAPGGGAVAAVTVAMAAGLAGMAARFSDQWDGAAAAAERADALRARAAPLAEDDAEAYGSLLTARRLPPEAPDRSTVVEQALSHAAEVPLAIADAALEVCELAALAVERGSRNLRGDAVAAALLAEAAGRAAANLVGINLERRRDDDRVARAEEIVVLLSGAARRALAAAG